ncbi:MAG: hypothetical protein IKH57_21350 [Clostridia bacterium]|nr:hypothetical protein [Clostridia bacterium]
MDESIRISVRELKKALDKLEEKACAEIKAAKTKTKEIDAFWKYGETLLVISNTLEEAGMMA